MNNQQSNVVTSCMLMIRMWKVNSLSLSTLPIRMDQVASGHVALGTLLSKSSNCFCRRFSRQHFKTIKLLTWKVILSWVRFEIIISFGKGSSSNESLFPIKTRTFVLSRDSDYKKFHLVREMKFNAPENCLEISILEGTDDDQHVSRRAGRDHFTDYSFLFIFWSNHAIVSAVTCFCFFAA